jgi:hypothetical protein
MVGDEAQHGWRLGLEEIWMVVGPLSASKRYQIGRKCTAFLDGDSAMVTCSWWPAGWGRATGTREERSTNASRVARRGARLRCYGSRSRVGGVFGTLTYPHLILPYSAYYGRLASQIGGPRCSPIHSTCTLVVQLRQVHLASQTFLTLN